MTPIRFSFHDDPNEGTRPGDPYPPAEPDVSRCELCGTPVGVYLREDLDGYERPRFEVYGAVEYDDDTFRFWCEDCWEPAAAVATVLARKALALIEGQP